MTPATQAAYRKLAANFYAKRLGGQQPSPKRIADALKACAGEYRPDYWRRLRNALAYDQEAAGYPDAAKRINETKNPLTRNGPSNEVPGKQRRVKRIEAKDEAKLLDSFIKSGDRESYGAVIVARYTGARPVEFASITIQDGKVVIPGAKKSHGGDRGADRVIDLDPQALELVRASLPYLKDAAVVGRVQDRISAAGRRLWPQRKAVPSLYSWRHQMGSNLKASGMSRKEVAYVMGHQSTASVDRYGNRKTAGGGKVPRAADPAAVENVRELHSEPPSAPAAPSAKGGDLKNPAALVASLKSSDLPLNTREIGDFTGGKSRENQGLGRDDGLKPGR